MSVKLRLQRFGRKKRPYYHVVAADGRAPRDGKFIERIGSYDPTTNPATIELNLDKAVDWLQKGAQPTDTVRALLSYKGAMHKNHLLNGVRKGALTEDQVEEKFNAWLESKAGLVDAKKSKLSSDKAAKDAETFERESKKRLSREKDILAKNSPLAEEVADAPEAIEETATEVTPAEETAPVAEVEAAPEAEATPEAEAEATETPAE
jgi:small subunit ribosomal protein S16